MKLIRAMFLCLYVSSLVACGGSPADSEQPDNPSTSLADLDATDEASRFLSQTTFGPKTDEIDELLANSAEEWFVSELTKTPTLHLPNILSMFPDDGSFLDEDNNALPELAILPHVSFWQAAIEGDDQLRQRMAFALSQIFVISTEGTLEDLPQVTAHYMDVLTQGAFGNFRDLLEAITYSPAMAIYLTYLRNEKADPTQNRVPDENYAREVLQLFSIGLLELEANGERRLDETGQEIEIYDNGDITELAKVFTGLSFAGERFDLPFGELPSVSLYSPLQMFDSFHSTAEKSFLGVSIPANTGGDTSIDIALDTIFNHSNVGPFLGRQLIQRFVTSAPAPEYVGRVAKAFNDGQFTLPNGVDVGNGSRGDLSATLAAVLFDEQARDLTFAQAPEFGRIREPILRFTHWARAFNVNSADSTNEVYLINTALPSALGQQAYRSPSVFNFYRPGYVAAGTETGEMGLTAPELQITNAGTIVGYANFIAAFVLGNHPQISSNAAPTFQADYSPYTQVGLSTSELLDALEPILTHGRLTETSRARILSVLDQVGTGSESDRLLRAQEAIIMILTSPEYIVLR